MKLSQLLTGFILSLYRSKALESSKVLITFGAIKSPIASVSDGF